MIPSRRCSVLEKKTGRCCARCSPFDHSEAILVVDFDSCKRFCQRARSPFVEDELMKGGKGFSATLGSNSALPHRRREGCNFSFAERQKSPRDVLPQKLPILMGRTFLGGQPLVGHT